MSKPYRFAAAVRKALGPYDRGFATRLIRPGIVARDDRQAPYDTGPPISPLHS